MNYILMIFFLLLLFWNGGYAQTPVNMSIDKGLTFFKPTANTHSIPTVKHSRNSSTEFCEANLTDADISHLFSNYIIENTYQAGNSITTSSVVASGTHVAFEAGNRICLEPGFETETMSEFSANIVSCDTISLPCIYSIELDTDVNQPSRDASIEVNYEVIDNSTYLNTYTAYCYELDCQSNVISEVYKSTQDPPPGANSYTYNASFTVTNPGIYFFFLTAKGPCFNGETTIDEFEQVIWHPFDIHPCE